MRLSFSFVRMSFLTAVGFLCFSFFVVRVYALAPTGMGGPPNNSQGAPIHAMIDREFDLALSGATLTVSGGSPTVILKANQGNAYNGTPEGVNLCTAVNMMAPTRIVCEHGPLQASTWYSFIITTGVKSADTEESLASEARYQFQTTNFVGGDQFIAPPIVIGGVPRAGNRLPINAKIRVFIDVGGSGSGTTMRTSGDGSVFSADNVRLFAASNGQPTGPNLLACTVGDDPYHPSNCNMALTGSLMMTEQQLIITPGKRAPAGTVDSTGGTVLTASGQYILIVKGTSGGPMGVGGVRNSNNMGIPDGDYFVQFSTVTSDATGPDVRGSSPTNATTNVNRAIYNISIGFTEAIEDSSVTENTILLYKDANANGEYNDGVDTQITDVFVDYYPERDEAVVSPTVLLDASKAHFIVVTTGVKDVAGNIFDGNRVTGGNQAEVITFTTGTLTNGQATDNVPPAISFANANNFSVAITFSEPVQIDTTANSGGESSDLPFVVNNIRNWTLESPLGISVNLNGKDIEYIPGELTATIYGVMLPPNQEFRVKVATSTGAVRIKDYQGVSMVSTGSGNLAKGTVQNAMENGMLGPGGGGEYDFFDRGMKPIRVFPRAGLAGATSAYEVEFPADTIIPSGGKVVLTFPTGFGFVADGGSTECQDAVTNNDNSDLNGPSTGTVTIASIACSGPSRIVTVTTGGAATVAGDRVRFILQGIVNSTVPKDYTTSGYTVDIKTKDVGGSLLESRTSMPFFLTTPGSQSIGGTLFNDNGDGGGTANDGIKNGGEAGTGINNVKICLGGMMGFSCTTTTNGVYTFGTLSNGFYHLEIPPLTAGNYVGGPFSREINLSGGQSRTAENFALRTSNRTVSVSISGIPTGTDLDVFAFNPTNMAAGGNIVRSVLWADGPQDGTDTASLPVGDGTWEIGVGPWMPKDPSLGPQSMPNMNFMPPKPQQVQVSGVGTYNVAFALRGASQSIVGKVVDGAGNAVQNAFVLARPASRTDDVGGGGVAQTKSDGTFSVLVSSGVYVIDASIPGMPPSTEEEVTVQNNTAAVDGNSSADVYSNGTLLTAGNILTLRIAKGDRSISGRVLDDSGNPIAYAHVNAQQVDGSGNPLGPFTGSPTDSSGNFTIYVKDGTWKVFGFAPGFGQLPSLTVSVAGSSVTGQNLQASSSEFGTLTGSVLKSGSGVAGAFVNVYGPNGGNGTVSDSAGKYSIKVRAGAGYTIDGFVPGAGRLTPITGVTVTANQTLTGQNLLISAPGTIRVTISGVTDAFVEARDGNGRGNGTSSNTTAGVYDIPVPAGTYTVRANQPRLGVIGTQSSVQVTANNTTAVTFSPSTTYTVSGVVNSSSATCKNGASVVFSDITNGRVTMATSDVNGAFSISLPDGSYREMAGKSGCIDADSPETITVAGAAITSGVDRTLTAANATVSGRVTLSGTGVSLLTKVIAESSDGKFAFADVNTSLTGGPNNYTLNLTPGTWTVKARSEGYESTTQSVSIASGGSETANFSLTAISGYTRYDPKSSTITPSQGGLVRDSNIGSNFEINIPAGAFGSTSDAASVTTTRTTAIATQTANSIVVGGKGIEITPTNASGMDISTLSSSDGAGVTLTIPYSDADIPEGVEEGQMMIAYWSENTEQWESLATTVDTANNTLTAITTHFSTFAPVAPRGSTTTTSSPSGTTTTSTAGGGAGGRRGGPTTYFVRGVPVTIELAPQVVVEELMKSVRGHLSASVGGQDLVFRDVQANAWYARYVATVIQSGIASGYRDAEGNLTGEFGPGNNVTYAEIAKMAMESGRKELPSGPAKNRSAQNDWSEPYIRLAEDLDVSVFGNDLDVRQPASRGAVIQTLVEVLKITKPQEEVQEQVTGTGSLTGSGTLSTGTGSLSGTGTAVMPPVQEEEEVAPVQFKDVSERNSYAEAINLAAELGIVSGDTDAGGNAKGTFRPSAPINRAEVAKIFTKLIELGYVK